MCNAAHSSQIPTGYLHSATQIFFINYTKYAYYFFFFHMQSSPD